MAYWFLMKILIFGAGAMGSVFGGFLSRHNEVTLLGRGGHIDSIKEKGLTVSGIWGKHRFRKIKAVKSIDELPKNPGFDLVMITTKAYDTEGAVKSISPFLSEKTLVMSMQNGIGNEDAISHVAGSDRTIGGMAIFGARMVRPGHVEVTVYASECLVGALNKQKDGRVKEIADVFSTARIPTKLSDDIIRDKWMKAFYNIALNPLSAILNVPYGELAKNETTTGIMKDLLKEAFLVAKEKNIPLKFTLREYFKHLIEKQLPPTASHRSSMLQDIERGKKTEIDYLNGAIVNFAGDLGVLAPVNKTITSIIRYLEARTEGV